MDVAFRRAVDDARRQGGVFFACLLTEDRIPKAFGSARWFWQGWIYFPAVTLLVLLSQCLSADHSCNEAVARLIAWHQPRLPGFDDKILSLYAKGMTTRDIQELLKEPYRVDVSPTLISEIMADLDADVKTWQKRRLERVWPIVYLDGIIVHIRGESGHVSQHTMSAAMGVNLAGKKAFSGRRRQKYVTSLATNGSDLRDPIGSSNRGQGRALVLVIVLDGSEESRVGRHVDCVR